MRYLCINLFLNQIEFEREVRTVLGQLMNYQ